MVENPSAFPVKVKRNTSSDPLATPSEIQFEGMSLRDWFASGIASALCTATDNTGMWTGLIDDSTGYAIVAERSYKMADALLAARKKGGDS